MLRNRVKMVYTPHLSDLFNYTPSHLKFIKHPIIFKTHLSSSVINNTTSVPLPPTFCMKMSSFPPLIENPLPTKISTASSRSPQLQHLQQKKLMDLNFTTPFSHHSTCNPPSCVRVCAINSLSCDRYKFILFKWEMCREGGKWILKKCASNIR